VTPDLCGFGQRATASRPLGDHGPNRKRGDFCCAEWLSLAPWLSARKLLKRTSEFDLSSGVHLAISETGEGKEK